MKISKDLLKYLALFGNLGFIVMYNILLWIAFYKIYERFVGFSSLVFISFVFIGIVSAFYNIYKYINK